MLERKGKEHREEGEREILPTRETGMPVKNTDKQERRERMKESRYNRDYERCMIEEIPQFLVRESAKEKKIMARFRCGNEERENK
jgi:hypothetical protein